MERVMARKERQKEEGTKKRDEEANAEIKRSI